MIREIFDLIDEITLGKDEKSVSMVVLKEKLVEKKLLEADRTIQMMLKQNMLFSPRVNYVSRT
jgi:hypothetical protein